MQTEEQNHELKRIESNKHEANIDKCILNIIKQEKYTIYNVIKKPIYTNGANYLGSLYEVDVKGETAEGPKTTSIFIKTLAPDHIEMELLSLDEIYKRENFVYMELSKIFTELEYEAKVPLLEERYKMPKVYAVQLPKTLFLENLTRRGFETRFRMDVVTLDFAEESLKELAKFHALSFVLKVKRPNYFDNFIRTIKSPINFEKPWKEHMDTFLNLSLKYLNTKVRNEIEDQLRRIAEKFPKYMSEDDGICCLCHGDYRASNLLSKEVDGRVIEIIPVDYQLMFYGNPVLDIIYFIYMSTDFEFRKNHLQHLKDHYHESFKEFLGFFDLSIDSVFSRQQFERIYGEKSDFGLMVTILLGPFQFAAEDNVPDVKKDAMSEWNMKLDDRFKDRLDDVVKEFIL